MIVVEGQKLLDFIKLFAPHFNSFHIDYLVSFATLNLNWTDNKIITTAYVLAAEGKITIEDDIIKIN